MAKLGTAFNANEVEPGQPRDFAPMPPGKYMAMIVNSGERQIKPKPGQPEGGDYGSFIALEIEIVGGEFERRKLFENLVLNHSNQQTVQIAQQTLREICLACKKPKIEDSEELHNILFIVDLIVAQDRRNRTLQAGQPQYPPVNQIKSYLPADEEAQAAGAGYVPAGGGNGGAGATQAGMTNGAAGGQAGAAVMGRPGGAAPATGGGLPWGPKN